jgi:hypothetical protein
MPGDAEYQAKNPGHSERTVRHGTFRDCIEDKQEARTAQDRTYDPVESPMPLIQALQVLQERGCVGLWGGLPKGG